MTSNEYFKMRDAYAKKHGISVAEASRIFSERSAAKRTARNAKYKTTKPYRAADSNYYADASNDPLRAHLDK